jgi:hypothetical protein
VPRNTRGREHRPLPEKITDLAANVLDGTIRLPKFQRDFVWTRQQVLDLLDSIARGYPIGSFLLWKSTVNLAKHYGRIDRKLLLNSRRSEAGSGGRRSPATTTAGTPRRWPPT